MKDTKKNPFLEKSEAGRGTEEDRTLKGVLKGVLKARAVCKRSSPTSAQLLSSALLLQVELPFVYGPRRSAPPRAGESEAA